MGADPRNCFAQQRVPFQGNGRRLIQPWPTFEAIQDYAKSLGSEVVSVALNRRYAHDLDAMLSHVDASTGLVYVCNPNNPTASLTLRSDLEKFIGQLGANTRVVIDEAYHDTSPDRNVPFIHR